MLIVCWNVAGLSTTVNRINDAFGGGGEHNNNNNNKQSKANYSTVLAEYMKRHGADIFCIQEHKIPLSQLSTRSEPLGCSSIEGYESFWSCCVDQSKRGLNGVVTFVKTGMVQSANSKPLGSPDLDEQGRCVMTDHGRFVIFNVYVPAGGGQPLSYKMKFLNALRRAMKEQRTKGKEVMLVGDLNISHTKLDQYWSDRVVFVNDILQEVASNKDGDALSCLPQWKLELASAWPHKIVKALETKKVVPTQTTNPLTNQKYSKYRMTAQLGEGRQVFLGKNESEAKYCEYHYDFDSWSYVCADTDDRLLAEEPNVVRVSVLTELMMKIAGVVWDEATQRSIAATAGDTSRISPTRKWLTAVIQEDGMVDSFRHFYPSAEGRYTCWNQFTNRRYTNEGARIDFTMVDSSLLPLVQQGVNVDSLRCCCCSNNHDPNSDTAALCAATANGAFQPVSFEGGGIIESRKETLDTQFGTAHTGMIYTPPSFSDHIAISLLLDDTCCSLDLKLNETDPATKRAQPHKSQKSIKSFFMQPGSTKNAPPPTSALCTTKKKPVVSLTLKRKGIQNFFVPKGQDNGVSGTTTKRSNTHSVNSSSSLKAGPKRGSILNHFSQKN